MVSKTEPARQGAPSSKGGCAPFPEGAARKALLIIGLCLFADAAHAGWGVADVIEVRGKARVHRADGAEQTASPLQILGPGDELRTGAGGRLAFYHWSRREKVWIEPETSLQVKADTYHVIRGSASAMAAGSAPAEPDPIGGRAIRGRRLWMEGKLDEAARQYELASQRGDKTAKEQLAVLEKERKLQEKAFKDAVSSLAKQRPPARNERWKVAVGRITHAEDPSGGPFSGYLASQLSLAVTRSEAFAEISRRELQDVLEETRLCMTGLVKDCSGPAEGKAWAVDAILTGTYTENPDGLLLQVSLVSASSAEKLAAASVLLARDSLPLLLPLHPENKEVFGSAWKAWEAPAASGGDFQAEVWVDRGCGGLYREGDELTVIFRSSRDAYVRLYHTNAEGRARLIFPNAYASDAVVRAGQLLRVPARGMPFSFRAAEQFGAEMIKAVASRAPLPASAVRAGQGGPFVDLGPASPELVRGLRKQFAPLGEELAESSCAFSVSPK
ncbi:MAG: DUF4384 domain-containing protein [Elusimicrobia bacterium]|nr:DUF4384 domain-containing protein [Elusimicrobiota bacterium]